MLDKIVNINSNFRFKGGGSSSPGFDKIFQGVINSKLNPNDSIKFSPLAQYLSRINWQLKELSFISRTRLRIEFIFDGFDFSAELDLIEYFKDNRQSFIVFRTIESGLFISKILLRISSFKRKLVLTEIPEKFELKGLFRLFEKISLMESDPDKLKNTLQEGIRSELRSEFEFINVVIYNLINKIGSIKVPENLIFQEDDTEPVIIEKITTVHDRRLPE